MEDSKESSSGVTELGLGNVGGVFVVLLTGLALAAFVAVIEFFWKARKLAHVDREQHGLHSQTVGKKFIPAEIVGCANFATSTLPLEIAGLATRGLSLL
ncbi:hypothetical protein TNCV_4214601 [Trichonephila clavipes]|nr:hypothetical protein TNCV_4214601 [Trichonephila clavipes]